MDGHLFCQFESNSSGKSAPATTDVDSRLQRARRCANVGAQGDRNITRSQLPNPLSPFQEAARPGTWHFRPRIKRPVVGQPPSSNKATRNPPTVSQTQ